MDSFVFCHNKGNVKDILTEGQTIIENQFFVHSSKLCA